MGQEFIIKSQTLEDKVNQLLPSQGGFQAGVDLSASTTIIPIIDLTESAEGSNLRQDLQTALSLVSNTFTSTSNTTNTLITTTGYFRIFGTAHLTATGTAFIRASDGATSKFLYLVSGLAGTVSNVEFDFVVFVPAGVTIDANTNSASITISTSTRQIADLAGNLTNPL